MIYHLILCDLDGTITDPKIGITNSIKYALKKFDIDEEDQHKLELFIGPPLLESFMQHYAFSSADARLAVDYYREYYTVNGIFATSIYEGMPELIKILSLHNKNLILATSKPTVYAARILKYLNLDRYFASIVGSNLDCTRTDKADVIQYALSKPSGVLKEDVVMVGDRSNDVIGAKKNNIDSIAVTYGYGSLEEIASVDPTYTVDTVAELKSLIIDGKGL